MIRTGKNWENRYYMDIFKKIIATAPLGRMEEASLNFADITVALTNNWPTADVQRVTGRNYFFDVDVHKRALAQLDPPDSDGAGDSISFARMERQLKLYERDGWKFFAFIDQKLRLFPGSPHRTEADYRKVASARLTQLMYGRLMVKSSGVTFDTLKPMINWKQFNFDRLFEFLLVTNFFATVECTSLSEYMDSPQTKGLSRYFLHADHWRILALSDLEFEAYRGLLGRGLKPPATVLDSIKGRHPGMDTVGALRAEMDLEDGFSEIVLASGAKVAPVIGGMLARHPQLFAADVPIVNGGMASIMSPGAATPVDATISEIRLHFAAVYRFISILNSALSPASSPQLKPASVERAPASFAAARATFEAHSSLAAKASSEVVSGPAQDFRDQLDVLFRPEDNPESRALMGKTIDAGSKPAQSDISEALLAERQRIANAVSASLRVGGLAATVADEEFLADAAITAEMAAVSGYRDVANTATRLASLPASPPPPPPADSEPEEEYDETGVSPKGSPRASRAATPVEEPTDEEVENPFGGADLGDLNESRPRPHVLRAGVDPVPSGFGANVLGALSGRRRGERLSQVLVLGGGKEEESSSDPAHRSPGDRVSVYIAPGGETGTDGVLLEGYSDGPGSVNSDSDILQAFGGKEVRRRNEGFVDDEDFASESPIPVPDSDNIQFLSFVNGGINATYHDAVKGEQDAAKKTMRAAQEGLIDDIEQKMTRHSNAASWLVSFNNDVAPNLQHVATTHIEYEAYKAQVAGILAELGIDAKYLKEFLKMTSRTEQLAFLAFLMKVQLLELMRAVVKEANRGRQDPQGYINEALYIALDVAILPPAKLALARVLKAYMRVLNFELTEDHLQVADWLSDPQNTMANLVENNEVLPFLLERAFKQPSDDEPQIPLHDALDWHGIIPRYAPILQCTADGDDPRNKRAPGSEKFDPKKGPEDLVRYLASRRIHHAEDMNTQLKGTKVKVVDAFSVPTKPKRTHLKGFERGLTYVGWAILAIPLGIISGVGKAIYGKPYNALKTIDKKIVSFSNSVREFISDKLDAKFLRSGHVLFNAASHVYWGVNDVLFHPAFKAYKVSRAEAARQTGLKSAGYRVLSAIQRVASGAAKLGVRLGGGIVIGLLGLGGVVHTALSWAARAVVYAPYFTIGALHYLVFKPIKAVAWSLKELREIYKPKKWAGVITKTFYAATALVWGTVYAIGAFGVGLDRRLGSYFDWSVQYKQKSIPLNPLYWIIFAAPIAFYRWHTGKQTTNIRETVKGNTVVHPTQKFGFSQAPKVNFVRWNAPDVSRTKNQEKAAQQKANKEARDEILRILMAQPLGTKGDGQGNVLAAGTYRLHADLVADPNKIKFVQNSASEPLEEQPGQVVLGNMGLHGYNLAQIITDLLAKAKRDGNARCTPAMVLKMVENYRRNHLGDMMLVTTLQKVFLEKEAFTDPLKAILESGHSKGMTKYNQFKAKYERVLALITTSTVPELKAYPGSPMVLAWMIVKAYTDKGPNSLFQRKFINDPTNLVRILPEFSELRIRSAVEYEHLVQSEVHSDLEIGLKFLYAFKLDGEARIDVDRNLAEVSTTKSLKTYIRQNQPEQTHRMEDNFVTTLPVSRNVPTLLKPLTAAIRFHMIQENKLVTSAYQPRGVEETVLEPLKVLDVKWTPAAPSRLQLARLILTTVQNLIERRKLLAPGSPERKEINEALAYLKVQLNQPIARNTKTVAKARNAGRQDNLMARNVAKPATAQIVPAEYDQAAVADDAAIEAAVHQPKEPSAMTIEQYLALFRPVIDQSEFDDTQPVA